MIFRYAIVACVLPSAVNAADWSEFRGPQGSSFATSSATLPDSFDVETGENIAWKAKLPGRGVSGPVVTSGRVVVTASSGTNRDRLHVLGFDQHTGKQLWHRQLWATGRTLCHPTSANAAPTPVTDGERVFAFYSSNDLVCLDLDGKMQWFRGLVLDHPGLGNDVGMASSPVVSGDVVVVQCECQANSFATGYDRMTGEERWSLERPASANWASPVAIEVETNDTVVPAVVFQSGESLAAYRSDSGALLWELNLECSGIPSASGGDGILYVPTERGLVAVATAATHQGDRILWKDDKLKCGNPSPIVTDDQLLIVNRAGVLTGVSSEDGSGSWKKRLGGRYWATPVVSGDRLYAFTDSGEAVIVQLSDEKLLNKCQLGSDEGVFGSPAVVDGAIFVRSHGHLWKISPETSE